MTDPKRPKILAFAGSTRKESLNKKLVRIAALGAEAAGAEVEILDLADYPLPLYDGDLEADEGMPENAVELKRKMIAADGFLISNPEYNSSVTGVLKNAIDWASRRQGDEPSLAAFRDKAAVLMAASPGALGGLRGLVHLRAILGNLGMIVLPQQRAVPEAYKAFGEDGSIEDETLQVAIDGLGERLAGFLERNLV